VEPRVPGVDRPRIAGDDGEWRARDRLLHVGRCRGDEYFDPDHKVVKIARATLTRLEMSERGKSGPIPRARMHRSLKDGSDALFSPMAPAGIVLIPGTLAWGAVALPFCLLGDLHAKIHGKREIKPI